MSSQVNRQGAIEERITKSRSRTDDRALDPGGCFCRVDLSPRLATTPVSYTVSRDCTHGEHVPLNIIRNFIYSGGDFISGCWVEYVHGDPLEIRRGKPRLYRRMQFSAVIDGPSRAEGGQTSAKSKDSSRPPRQWRI